QAITPCRSEFESTKRFDVASRDIRDQYLAAVRSRHDPLRLVYGERDISVTARGRKTGVNAHTHPQARVRAPLLLAQSAVSFAACTQRSSGVGKRTEARVARGAHVRAAMLFPHLAQQVDMAFEHVVVTLLETAKHASRRLDIGQNEGDDATREFRVGHRFI